MLILVSHPSHGVARTRLGHGHSMFECIRIDVNQDFQVKVEIYDGKYFAVVRCADPRLSLRNIDDVFRDMEWTDLSPYASLPEFQYS